MSNLDIKIKREKSFPHCGRLIVMETLDSRKPLQEFNWDNHVTIEFPAMPDQIELARQTDYKVVSNMVVPDGVHQYRYTSPLSIPFSFVLHSMDTEYCPDGPLTLLRLAARLHSLVLPFGDSSAMTVTVTNDAPLIGNKADSGAKSPKTEQNQEKKATDPDDPSFETASNSKFDPPVTVRLELMFTRDTEPGIVCTGYIKDVRAVLKGPWLKGPDRSFNLPSSGEFSFTFVHRPAHYNSFSNQNGVLSTNQSQAFAQYVLQNLYNTRHLGGTGDYRGFKGKV